MTIGSRKMLLATAQEAVSTALAFTLLDTITGNDSLINTWTQYTYSVSDGLVANQTGRIMFSYKSGSSFTGDQQVDSVEIDGTTNTFQSNAESYERTEALTGSNAILFSGVSTAFRSSVYNARSWTGVSTATSGNGLWLRDNNGTSSQNTGSVLGPSGVNTDFYLYYESSGSTFPQAGWLRTPSVTLDASPSVAFKSSRFGATMGTLEVWWVSNG